VLDFCWIHLEHGYLTPSCLPQLTLSVADQFSSWESMVAVRDAVHSELVEEEEERRTAENSRKRLSGLRSTLLAAERRAKEQRALEKLEQRAKDGTLLPMESVQLRLISGYNLYNMMSLLAHMFLP
jgi:hypothetical protein